jgi:hypothetical protein
MHAKNTNGPWARAECETGHEQPDSNNSADDSQPPSWVSVSKTVKCNRCGRANLCVTRRTREGKLEANRRGFHKCQPSFTNAHGVEVSDADIPF